MSKPKKEVNPDVAISRLPIFYTGTIMVGTAVAIVVSLIISTPENDLFNVTTLVLEITFGVLITWTVFIYTKKWKKDNDKVAEDIKENVRVTLAQQSKISTLITKINEMESKQEKIIDYQEKFIQRRVMYYNNNFRATMDIFRKKFLEEKLDFLKAVKNKKSKQEILKIINNHNEHTSYHFHHLQRLSNMASMYIEPAVLTSFEHLSFNYSNKNNLSKLRFTSLMEFYDVLEKNLDTMMNLMPKHLSPTIIPSDAKNMLENFYQTKNDSIFS